MNDNGARPMVSVASMLGDHGFPASIDPDKAALQWDGGERTYRELRARARSLAASFRRQGITVGSRVVLHLFNRGETFEVYFACAYAGLTLIPTNFRFRASELASVLEDAEPALIITQRELAEEVDAAIDLSGQKPSILVLDDAASGREYDELAAGTELDVWQAPNDPHLVLFSSGTTGRPKGVAMSHHSILGTAAQSTMAYPLFGPDAVTLVVPPMFNAAGINDLVAATFMVGGTVAIMPSRGWSAERLAQYAARHKATHTLWFPTMLKPLMALPYQARKSLSSLRSVVIGGEHCTAAVQRHLRTVFPGVRFTNTYGLTEGGLITLLPHDEFDDAPNSVGRVSPGGQVVQIRHADGETPCAGGDVGEIWTAANFLPEGYWRGEEMNRDAYRNGWLKTGDLGRIDENGYLYLEGRSRDLIISKGQNIYPAEIESVLMEIAGVRACAVVGVPDEDFGERPFAVVVAEDERHISPEQLIDHVGERLASYKRPAGVLFKDTLPLTDNNKVSKRELLSIVLTELSLAGNDGR